MHRAVIIDSNLEIPDNDSSVSLKDKIIGGDVNFDIFNNFGCFNFLMVKTVNASADLQFKTGEAVNGPSGSSGGGGNSRKRKLPSKGVGDEQTMTTSSTSTGRRSGGGSSSSRDVSI
jgi:hypothetical protein